MTTLTRRIQKALAGVQDILFGQGSVFQIRNGVEYEIEKVNADKIPYSGDAVTTDVVTIKEKIDDVVLNLAGYQNVVDVVETLHGHAVGEWVRVETTAETGVSILSKHVAAQGDTEVNAEIAGVVVEVVDVNKFKLAKARYIELTLAQINAFTYVDTTTKSTVGWTKGARYNVDPLHSGCITDRTLSVGVDGVNAVTKLAFIALSATTGYILHFKAIRLDLLGHLTATDDHAQYLFLTGRASGQIITGGTDSGASLILQSTSDSTKGAIIVQDSLGIGTITPKGIFDATPDTIGVTSYAFPWPRMTTIQMNALTGMIAGAYIWNTTVGGKFFYNGSAWIQEVQKSYNGNGTDFTVTLSAPGTVDNAPLVPYQTSDGSWRLKFNIHITLSTAALTVTATVPGITYAAYQQAVSLASPNARTQQTNRTSPSTNTLTGTYITNTTAGFRFSGDVELSSKPTWAD